MASATDGGASTALGEATALLLALLLVPQTLVLPPRPAPNRLPGVLEQARM